MPTKSQQRRARLQQKKHAVDPDMEFLNELEAERKAQAAVTAQAAQQALETQQAQPSLATQPVADTSGTSPTSDQETKENKIPEDFGIPREKVVQKANEIWKVLKAYVVANPDFKALKDQDKLELFRTKFGYAMFMDEFPIVSRYMVCHGQYSPKAFDRMLMKIEKTVHPPPDKREPGYMEDQWVMRQADYVQYLWESYQKRHQNTAERQWVWKFTYDNLKKEFDDFRNMHKEIEERVKTEKKTLAGQNARELLMRLASGEQNLNPDEEALLLEELKTVFEKKTSAEANPDAQQEEEDSQEYNFDKQKDPKILMIETIDVERMKEIDDKYKPKELVGMEPILESANENDTNEPQEDEIILKEEVIED